MIKTQSLHDYISPTSEIIEEARAGRIFILVDDEDRENEGDLVIPAQFATTEVINFMARHARGLICLAMTTGRVHQLGLQLMSAHNRSRHASAFTVSIEARHGISTGISAADRARTVAVAINSENPREEIATPGHIFPLAARDGGSLVRAGHTEAAVDIARLAGLNPSGVICEVMNEDGTMARMPELIAFAQRHNIKLGTIADLIQYRRRTEKLVTRSFETWTDDLEGGDWAVKVFEDRLTQTEHLALVKGDLAAPGPSLVRVHSVDPVTDLLGPGRRALAASSRIIAQAGRGVIVLLRDNQPGAVSRKLGLSVAERAEDHVLRQYGIGAQILIDLGVKDMILLTNHPRSLIALEGFGLNIVDQQPFEERDGDAALRAEGGAR
ncbi:MAG TPA: 3,4-dihydroxy-2-butanone-4-phosphate synthase [Acidisoma sp.]|nr:3,4-dihydroxy-2-butanone-4-phosphate synthase [Acidisoma sp.]